jgi:hypothetical protein
MLHPKGKSSDFPNRGAWDFRLALKFVVAGQAGILAFQWLTGFPPTRERRTAKSWPNDHSFAEVDQDIDFYILNDI